MHMQASTGHKIFVQSIKTDVSCLISTASLIVEDRLAISLSGCLCRFEDVTPECSF
jgi:hypothetical protein